MGHWRRKWQDNFEWLTLVEGLEVPADLRRAIEEVLSDEQRSGGMPTFTAEQLTQIIAVACEAVEDSGRPVARWSQREIRDEAVKRGIVESISLSHLCVLLAEAQGISVTCQPEPIDTTGVDLSPEINQLIERLAKHNHDDWARQRIGPQRNDDRKEHPGVCNGITHRTRRHESGVPGKAMMD